MEGKAVMQNQADNQSNCKERLAVVLEGKVGAPIFGEFATLKQLMKLPLPILRRYTTLIKGERSRTLPFPGRDYFEWHCWRPMSQTELFSTNVCVVCGELRIGSFY